MADEDIYENMPMTKAAPQPKGNPPKTSVPWRHRARGIVVTAVLLLLGLALAMSLLAVTLLYLRAQSKLQAVEEAVQKLQVSLQPDDASDASAKGSDSLKLLDEAQAGVQKLKAELGNVSAAYGEIQIQLDNVSAARAAVQGRCRVSLQGDPGRSSLDWTHRPGDRRQLALGGRHRIQSRRKQGVLGGESARQLGSGDWRQRRLCSHQSNQPEFVE
ncbi:uncharacterized protein LOC120406887 [Mauremys reevesii]|uniref:uncharacterized protein LOC120406887 n=1 Tax=Mauremys reevesii TaxID=260615 RepID=UPI00193FD6FE|nr:uncharacterized protein LOC120406887 [Mauremys reevesii]